MPFCLPKPSMKGLGPKQPAGASNFTWVRGLSFWCRPGRGIGVGPSWSWKWPGSPLQVPTERSSGRVFLRDRELITPQGAHSIFAQQCLIESSYISLKSVSLLVGPISSHVAVPGKPSHFHARAYPAWETDCLHLFPTSPLPSSDLSLHLWAQNSEHPPTCLKLRSPGPNLVFQVRPGQHTLMRPVTTASVNAALILPWLFLAATWPC